MVRELVAEAEGDEEIRWRRRADAEASARSIESLVEQEADRRVAIWRTPQRSPTREDRFIA